MQLTPIGVVESPLTDLAAAPKQGREGGAEASLVLEPAVRDGLTDLRPGDHVIVLTWLDRARRDVLRVHPQDDARKPLTVGISSPARITTARYAAALTSTAV